MAKCKTCGCERPATHYVECYAWVVGAPKGAQAVELVLLDRYCAEHATRLDQASIDHAWQLFIERFDAMRLGVPDPKSFRWTPKWGRPYGHHPANWESARDREGPPRPITRTIRERRQP